MAFFDVFTQYVVPAIVGAGSGIASVFVDKRTVALKKQQETEDTKRISALEQEHARSAAAVAEEQLVVRITKAVVAKIILEQPDFARLRTIIEQQEVREQKHLDSVSAQLQSLGKSLQELRDTMSKEFEPFRSELNSSKSQLSAVAGRLTQCEEALRDLNKEHIQNIREQGEAWNEVNRTLGELSGQLTTFLRRNSITAPRTQG
jgi:DNA anti-recombination protein RmuC